MILHQPGDIRIIFQHKNRLTQFVNLVELRLINVRLAHSTPEDCERTMNRESEHRKCGTLVYSRVILRARSRDRDSMKAKLQSRALRG